MNVWLIAATVFLWALVPCGIVCFRGRPMDRLVALEGSGVLATLTLLLLAEGFHRLPFYDVALTMALLSFGGSLVFARFLAKGL